MSLDPAQQDLVDHWNEDKLEPRFGIVTATRVGADGSLWLKVDGCSPRVDDFICIVSTDAGKAAA